METPPPHARNGVMVAGIGTARVALCCLTPVLVVVLGTVGLGALTPSLDSVWRPALAVLLVVPGPASRPWRQAEAGTTTRARAPQAR